MSTVFKIVDRPDEVPKRQMVTTVSKPAQIVNGMVVEREVAEVLAPHLNGVYVLGDPTARFFKERIHAFTQRMKKVNLPGQPPRLIGPFSDDEGVKCYTGKKCPEGIAVVQWAELEAQKARPKTDKEQVVYATADSKKLRDELEAERKAHAEEIDRLKAELEKRRGDPKK